MPRSQIIDVATQSLANPYGLSTLPPELYQELWWYSGGSATTTTSSYSYLNKGTTSTANTAGTAVQLLTLNSSWNPQTKCCLELTLWISNGAYTADAYLYDKTSSSTVAGSHISTNATTPTVFRSSQFTLTPGHTYEVAITSSNGGGTTNATDASLIVFPNQQLLAQGSLSNITLGTVGQKLTEAQIPLYIYSSGSASNTSTSVGAYFLAKGTAGYLTSTTDSRVKLHTLSTKWDSNQKFAFEASMWTGGSVTTCYTALYDLNTATQVTQLSTTSTTATILRSGSFTLTPGHVYGISQWGSNTSWTTYLTKAHLVPLFT